MDTEDAAGTPAPPAHLAAWFPGFVAAESQPDMVDQWVARTRTAIQTELPQLAQHPSLTDVLDDAVREHWLAFLAEFPQPEFRFHLVEGGRRLAEQVAEHQLPLEVLITIYRAAQQESWSYVTGVIGELPAEMDHTELLIFFWSRAATWIDRSIGSSIDVYQHARARIMAGTSAQRFEIVRALLAGEETDPKRASAALGGYPLSVHHTALLITTDEPDAVMGLDSLAMSAARAIGGSRPLVVQPGGPQVWAWVGTRRTPDLEALAALEPELRRSGARLITGVPAPEIAGFCTSHADALNAAEVAQRGGPWGRVMHYQDVELVALLGCNDEVDRFMRRTLRGLASPEQSARRIRQTVVTFLRHNGNVEETATTLQVHRNTVRYRLGQAETMLESPVNRFGPELALALDHHAIHHHDRTDS